MKTPSPEQALRTARILHAAFLGAVVVYAVMLTVLLSTGFPPALVDEPDAFSTIALILGLMSMANIGGGLFIPRVMMARAVKSGRSANAFLPTQVVRAAFFEAVGIYGFVLGLLGGDWLVSGPFFAVSLVALALSLPTAERRRTAGPGRGASQ